MASGSCCDCDSLHTDEFKFLLGRTFHFKAEFNRFTNAFGDLIQRSRLRVAPGKLRDRGNVIAFVIPFDYYIELVLQLSVLVFIVGRVKDEWPGI